MLKKILPFIIFIILVFTAVVLHNTITFSSKQISVEELEKRTINAAAIEHMAEAVKIKTVAANKVRFDSASFNEFSDFIASTYPRVESNLDKLDFNKYSLLYKWRGSSDQLKSLVLLAHFDVFPATDTTAWKVPAFSGEINSEAIWGRGTLNGKVRLIGMLEAVTHLLQENFTPERSIYFAFGHDKTIGGQHGAKAIATHMMQAGIEPELVMDGGYTISRGLVPGVLTDVAQIGTAQTGFVSLALSMDLEKGDMYDLQKKMAEETIQLAIARLRRNPLTPQLTGAVDQFIEFAGPETRFQTKMLYANKYLFQSAILNSFQQSGRTARLVQTSMVPTLLDMGITEETVSGPAKSQVHYSILPGSTIEEVIAYVRHTINDDRIEIKVKPLQSNPQMASDVNTLGYLNLVRSVKEVFPHVTCIPNLFAEAGDGRFFYPICNNIYRFAPVKLNTENNQSVHGVNEHIQIEDYKDMIRFYIRLIENISGKDNI